MVANYVSSDGNRPIAIHLDGQGYGKAWVEYCERNGVNYKIVDCHAANIIDEIEGCLGLMWHWNHLNQAAMIHARSLILCIERLGKFVYPNYATSWHYDDKVAQKYLFESLGYKDVMVPSYVFYRLADAMEWISSCSFPKVFKLKGGAGSENVMLVRTPGYAKRLIRKSFRSGWSDRRRFGSLKERIWRFRRDKSLRKLLEISLGIGRALIPRQSGIQIGYAYFQDFIPGNDRDIRVVVIGSKAFAIIRGVRQGDFRASGSGLIDYDPRAIPEDCLRLAFEISRRAKLQSAAYDFIFDEGHPKLVEVSYAFTAEAYRGCPGYWTQDMRWNDGSVDPKIMIIEEFLAESQIYARDLESG